MRLRSCFVALLLLPLSACKAVVLFPAGDVAGQQRDLLVISTLLMLNTGYAAQSAHLETLDPEFADLPILLERKDVQLETVMSNSFGFGGTNGCLVMARV